MAHGTDNLVKEPGFIYRHRMPRPTSDQLCLVVDSEVTPKDELKSSDSRKLRPARKNEPSYQRYWCSGLKVLRAK